MGDLVNPVLLLIGCAIGALGVAMALPRRGVSPQLLGAVVAGTGLAIALLAISSKSVAGQGLGGVGGLVGDGGGLPNFNFYVFAVIALGAALRVISHPRPVYAALYFILTILASAGLYVLLAAEFMAFALVIVYAGAILITYLFVIMLATESPTAEQEESLSEYDRYSREPVLATIVGFVLLGGLSSIMASGTSTLPPAGDAVKFHPDASESALQNMPRKVEKFLREARDPADPELSLLRDDEKIISIDAASRTVLAAPAGNPTAAIDPAKGGRRIDMPPELEVTNVEAVGFTLLAEYPGLIEIAGVILLMAMLGAVVLARRKIEMDERAKAEAAARMMKLMPTPDSALAGGAGVGGR